MSDLLITEENLRKMPFSLEAEQSILGAVILDPQRFTDIATVLHAEDFYMDQHQRIFEAMRDLSVRADTHLDEVTLADELIRNGTFEEAGGKQYLTVLAGMVPSVDNLPDYVRIVREKAVLRRLIESSAKISDMAYGAEGEVADILDRSEQMIFDIADKNETRNFVHIRDAILENYNHLKDLKIYGESALGIKTEFSDLDNVLVGLGKGDLVIVGARPGMGKTAFCLNIASNVAIKSRKTVAIFSLEMSAEQLVSRMLSSEALIDSYKMRKGNLEDDDWIKLSRAAAVLNDTDVLIDDTTGITVTGMKAKLRRIKNLGLVVVDYLQLMHTDRRIDNRVQEVSELSRGLKLLAKEFEVPVICCSQLSRTTEGRNDKKPTLSDLRESGSIEQDADCVLMLHRESYYKKDEENQNIATCIVAKNRHGSTTDIKLGWQGEYTRFSTLSGLTENG